MVRVRCSADKCVCSRFRFRLGEEGCDRSSKAVIAVQKERASFSRSETVGLYGAVSQRGERVGGGVRE